MTRTPNEGNVAAYLETTLTSNSGSILDVFNALPDTLGHWVRSRTFEAKAKTRGATAVLYVRQDDQEPMVCFVFAQDGQSAYVYDITPADAKLEITLQQSNELETELVNLMRPLLPPTVQVTQREAQHLKNLLQPSTYLLFQRHSRNESTGNSHPSDRKRWLAFVAQAAREGLTDEHRDLVHAALISEGFAPGLADKLTEDFDRHIEMAMTLI